MILALIILVFAISALGLYQVGFVNGRQSAQKLYKKKPCSNTAAQSNAPPGRIPETSFGEAPDKAGGK